MMEEGGLGERAATNGVALHGMVGAALGYKVARLRELRTQAERSLGDRFDVRDLPTRARAGGGAARPPARARPGLDRHAGEGFENAVNAISLLATTLSCVSRLKCGLVPHPRNMKKPFPIPVRVNYRAPCPAYCCTYNQIEITTRDIDRPRAIST
jgi:hypothetical protein